MKDKGVGGHLKLLARVITVEIECRMYLKQMSDSQLSELKVCMLKAMKQVALEQNIRDAELAEKTGI